MELGHPWQNGPRELISHAIEHLNMAEAGDNVDLNKRIAFLLLDVGVETTFKAYLLNDSDIANAKENYGERRKATEGNFHDLVKCIDRFARHDDKKQEKVKRESILDGINLGHVNFFHDTRNKVYHSGNGITVTTNEVREYAEISAKLLKRLLGVDLEQELRQPEYIRQETEKKGLLKHQANLVANAIHQFNQLAELAIEKIEPRLVLPSTKRILNDIAIRKKHTLHEVLSVENLILQFLTEILGVGLEDIANDVQITSFGEHDTEEILISYDSPRLIPFQRLLRCVKQCSIGQHRIEGLTLWHFTCGSEELYYTIMAILVNEDILKVFRLAQLYPDSVWDEVRQLEKGSVQLIKKLDQAIIDGQRLYDRIIRVTRQIKNWFETAQ